MKKLINLIILGGIVLLIFNYSYALDNKATPLIERHDESLLQKDIQKPNTPDYAKDRIIVKLKEGETLDAIKELNTKYNIVSAGPLFPTVSSPQDKLQSLNQRLSELETEPHQSWYWQLDKDSREYKDYIAKMEKEKQELRDQIVVQEQLVNRFEKRQERAPEGVEAPDLENIYLLEIEANIEDDEGGDENNIDIPLIVAEYNTHSNVEYAQPDYIMSTQMIPNDPYYASAGSWGQPHDDLWGLKKIEAEKAWDITQGENIIVSVVDSGVDYNHPDISENIWHNPAEIPLNGIDDDHNGYIDDYCGFDFINSEDTNEDGDYTDDEDVSDSDPMDDKGHGTHVAGTIAAVGNNGVGIIGVAPRAKIMSVKCLDSSGNGTISVLAKGILYSIDNNADVINNSWGCNNRCPELPLAEDVIRKAVSLGVVVVFAAGNSNDDAAYYSPQNMWETITVAASTEIDAKAVFSNYGYFIDISAPGAGENVSSPFYHRNILSLRAASTGDENLIVDSQYLRNAGTSMAAPHVAGAAAMILANQPSLTTEQVRQALKKGSDDILSAGYDKYSGAGRLNLHKALQINQPLEVVMTSPKEQSFFDVKNIEIKGTINGEGFLDWTLDYGIGENPTQWVSIASSSLPVIDDVLAVWDISDFLIEEIVLRLRANSKSGIFEDRRGCSITNAYITSPMHTDIINANQQIDIIATIAGKVTNYSVEYGRGLYPTEWLSKGVILTGLDQGASYNNIIATIAPNTLPEEGFYSLRLRIYNNQGARDLFVKMIFADFKLKKGWPVDFPKNSLALNDAQSFAVEDINNDGFKEIVTIRNPGKDFINNPDKDYEGNFLEVYDYQGRLLWAVLLSTRINNYDDAFAIADVDNDDYKEIFVNGNNKIGEIKAFHYDGTPMDGWPVLTKLSKGPMKIIADVDCDGNKEVVAWSNSDERLYIFSKEGNEKLDLFLPSGNISSYYSSLPAIGNLDEDRELEIIITQRQGDGDDYKGTNKIFAVNPDGTEVSGWPISLGEGRILNVVTGDIDNDGKDEVVVKFENSVYVFQGNGSLFPGWPIIDEEDFFSGSGVALADFDDDGDLEITWAKNNSLGTFTIHVVHHTGIYAQGWPQTAELAGVNNIVSPTIGDVNNDGKADIVIANGGLAKTLLVNGDWTTCGGVWAWDFDGSLISLNDMADVYPLFIQKPNCWLWYLPIAPVVITDVDNNGIVDLVVSSTCVETWDLENEFSIMSKCRGEIYIWELGTSFNAEQSFWPAGQHDFCNTGRYNGSDDGYINRSPVLDPIEDKEVDAGTRLSFIVSASDPDGDKVFIKGAKMLDGSSISTIGAELICDLEGITRFNWTPTVEQAGKNYYVCFEAVDDKRVVSEPLTVKIEVKINHIPYFSAIGNKTIDEGELLEFTVSANDCDGDELTYTVRDLPQGAVFKGQNFKWIPTYDQAGVYNMLFIVDDNKGGKNIEAITISVHNKVNTPPKIFFMFCSQEQEVEVGQLLEFIVVGKDAENDVFHIAATIPEEITNATFVQKANALGGVFRWKPTNAHAGKSYCISFDAVDRHYARSNTLIAEINVKAVNKPPVFTAVPAEHYQVKPGQSLNFPVSVYDSDGDTIMLSAKVVDGEQLISLDSIGAKFIGSSLGTNGYNTKTFIWTPKVEHGGNEYSVVFESNDDRGGRVSKTVTFAVIPSRAEIYSIELDAKDTRKCIIKGGDFGERNEHSIVYFGIYGEIVSWSDKEIVCILPEKIINQKIIYLCVHTRGGWSEWKSFSYRVSKEIKISHVSVKEVEKGQNLTLQVKVDNPQNVRYLKVRYKYYKEFNWRNRSWKYWSYGRRYVYNKNPDDKTIYTATIPCSRVVEGKGNVKYYIYGRDKSGKTHQIEWISTDVN